MLFLTLFHSKVSNERGQGLIEYLIIVALMGVASISIMRVVSQNVQARYGNISAALGAKTKTGGLESADASSFKKNDLSNFFDGAKSNRSNSKGGASADFSGDEAGGLQ